MSARLRALAATGLIAGLAVVVSPSPASAATFTVTTTDDTVDVAPGDGTCADAGGDCSLRAAIQEANAFAGPDTITLGAMTYVLPPPATSMSPARSPSPPPTPPSTPPPSATGSST